VLSENELLTRHGQRVHTGQSEVLNREFASSFTKHFARLATRYPVYADLENVFELAIVASLVQQERTSGHMTWSMPHLLDAEKYHVETARVPREVPSIVNHRVINSRHVVCAVSGGVSFPGKFKTASNDDATSITQSATVTAHTGSSWWWD
jgi:hypothetical protein